MASTNAQQQTSGIKVAQAGFDVRTCPDYDLLFNSSWPSISIVYDQTMAVTTDALGNARIAHNLGFVPLCMGWQFTDATMTISEGRFFPSVDKQYMYFPETTSKTTFNVNLKCYNLDITVPQNYTYIQPTAVNSIYDPTYGIKVVKQNLSITSNDMRSFILHSRCASPQVLSVVTDTTKFQNGIGNNGGTLQYTNPQNYTPWAFGYAQVTAFEYNVPVYQWAPPVSQSYPSIQFNSVVPNTVSMGLSATGGGTGKGSIILLRDPLFAATSVQAVY